VIVTSAIERSKDGLFFYTRLDKPGVGGRDSRRSRRGIGNTHGSTEVRKASLFCAHRFRGTVPVVTYEVLKQEHT